MKYTDMKSNESYKHKMAKTVIYNWMLEGKLTIADECGEEFICYDVHEDTFSNRKHRLVYSIESPVTREFPQMPLPKTLCFDKCAPEAYMIKNHHYSGGHCFTTITYDEEFYKVINSKMEKGLVNAGGAICFDDHVCNTCPFNNFDYKYIFDIGIARHDNRQYIAAIEITNKCLPSEKKIKYCKLNNIKMFEIDAEEILKYTSKPELLLMKRLA